MNKFISELDSERFGFKVAKLTHNIDDPKSIVDSLKRHSVALIIARIDATNLNLVNQLERIGFEIKDIQLTFNFNLQSGLPAKGDKPFSIVAFNKTHLDKLVKMTKESFINYGHYFNDDKLDKEKCGQIYSDWIKRCCESKEVADDIIVAVKDNIAIGYLAIKEQVAEPDGEKYYSGIIGAVSSEYRHLGVFREINIESLYIASERKAHRVENNVLLNNLPVIKTYTNLGYNIIRSELTLHYWVK